MSFEGDKEHVTPGGDHDGVVQGIGRLLGDAPSVVLLREQVRRVAEFPSLSVLIYGETGTGKKLVAQAIHELTFVQGAFARLDCTRASLVDLISALQPSTSGEPRTVLLEAADELSSTLQVELRGLLGNVAHRRPEGDGRSVVRVVAATNAELVHARSKLRPDLFHALSTFIVTTTPLRQRSEDILSLARWFVQEFCREEGRPLMTMTDDALALLHSYDWPGNVAELRSVIEAAATSGAGGAIQRSHIEDALAIRPAFAEAGPLSLELPRFARAEDRADGRSSAPVSRDGWSAAPPSSGLALVGKRGAFTSLPALEQHVITDIFRESNGNLSMAARTLGIPRSTLRDRLKKYGIAPPSSSKNRRNGSES